MPHPANPSAQTSHRSGALVSALVLLSGAAALVYEVLWARQLATFLGTTSLAQAAVIAAYMTGLALGSSVLGRLADRVRSPLRLVAALEGGIALLAATDLWLVPELEGLYPRLAAGLPATGAVALGAKGAVALLLLLPPTFLMGGTLPALVRSLASDTESAGKAAARLYGINTLGGAAGCLLAAYVLLPSLGVRGATLAAIGANSLIAACFWRLGAGARSVSSASAPPDPHPLDRHSLEETRRRSMRAAVLAVCAASGFAMLAAQMAWVRALTLVIGSSVYAFGAVLGVYLLGLGAGALALSIVFERRRKPPDLGLLAALQLGLGAALAFGLPLLRFLPSIFLAGWSAGASQSFFLLQVLWLALAASVMLVPTAIAGAALPAAIAAWRADPSRLGRGTGAVFAANTLGTVLGAPLAALVLLPELGVVRTLLALAALQCLAGTTLFSLAFRSRKTEDVSLVRVRRTLVTVAAISVFVAIATGRWDRKLMTSGPYINAFRLAAPPDDQPLRRFLEERDELLFYQEDADGVVTVRDDGVERILAINGKTDGTRLGDRRTQVAIGLLPLLASAEPRRALVIGLGTGISAGVVAADRRVEHIDVIEISRAVVAASSFFDAENGAVLLDSRVALQLQDARSFLHASEQRWDLVVSEPSNPWITGVANLFTREFFALLASRIAPGGVVAQWFHVYGMSTADLATAIATFRSVFPHTTVWIPQTGDLVLLGAAAPAPLDLRRFEELVRADTARERLAPANLLDERALLSMFLLGEEETARFAEGAPLNTDDRPRLELGAPRHLYQETTLGNLAAMAEPLAGGDQAAPVEGLLESEDGTVTAFGLRARPEDGETPRAMWRVGWTVLESAEAERGVRLAVTQTPTLLLERGERTIRISRAPRSSGDGLAGWLEDRLGADSTTESTSGEARLSDGTAAVWSVAVDGNVAGLAFDCPTATEGARFLALVARDDAEEALTRTSPEALAARLSCAGPEEREAPAAAPAAPNR